MSKVSVKAVNGNYDILIGKGLIYALGKIVLELGFKKAAIVTDNTVDSLYGSAVEKSLSNSNVSYAKIVIPAGEQSKSEKELFNIYNGLVDNGINRNDLIIAVGGGVVGDIAGFAASTYMRGIAFMQIPTTLLAQVDSSVGGKVAIDLPTGKNLVGSFYQPVLVVADMDTLDTLDTRQRSAGMSEVLKYACIADEKLIRIIESKDMERIVKKCCEIKADYVNEDPFDKGRRTELNFGHTIGHAIEVLSDYSLLHGEAVAIGMYAMARAGEKLNITQEGTSAEILRMLKYLGLKFELEFDAKDVVALMTRDKKVTSDGINVVMLEKIGKAVIVKLRPEKILEALK